MSAVLTVLIMLPGSVGMHRLLTYRSFECPKWLEHVLVYCGVLSGIGGPRRMLEVHELRDWCQRQPLCHHFFSHQSNILRDAFWVLNCRCELDHPPTIQPEPEFENDRFYWFLDRYWMAAQMPLAVVLFLIGGWSWCVWGISVRVAMTHISFWGIAYLVHNFGSSDWRVETAGVQGYNVRGLGLILLGEAWHNNHHAFPESARFGLKWTQPDPGYWFVVFLQSVGLAWNVKLPEHHPERVELVALNDRVPDGMSLNRTVVKGCL
mgnify:CR=1 FL=1